MHYFYLSRLTGKAIALVKEYDRKADNRGSVAGRKTGHATLPSLFTAGSAKH